MEVLSEIASGQQKRKFLIGSANFGRKFRTPEYRVIDKKIRQNLITMDVFRRILSEFWKKLVSLDSKYTYVVNLIYLNPNFGNILNAYLHTYVHKYFNYSNPIHITLSKCVHFKKFQSLWDGLISISGRFSEDNEPFHGTFSDFPLYVLELKNSTKDFYPFCVMRPTFLRIPFTVKGSPRVLHMHAHKYVYLTLCHILWQGPLKIVKIDLRNV